MDEKKTLVRPPFDENGNVVWTDEEKPMKKKALRWWVWLIPVGLICVIGLGVLLYRAANRKTPQELCRAALKDAFADALGYREPMMKALHMEDLSGILEKDPLELGLALSLKETNLTYGDLGIGGEEEKGRELSQYNGFGFSVDNRVDGDRVSMDLRGAISALTLSVLRAYSEDGKLYLASPKLLSEVLTVKPAEFPERWDSAPLWEALSKTKRESVKGIIRKGFELWERIRPTAKAVRSLLVASYPQEESEFDRMISSIRYEQCRDDKGEELTENVVIGSQKVPCYVFRIEAEENGVVEFFEKAAVAFGGENGAAELHKAWKFREQADGTDAVRVFAYVTKGGELARLTADISGLWYDRPATVSAEVSCRGAEDPQDLTKLTVKVNLDGKQYELTAEKSVKATRARVSSDISLSLQMPDGKKYGGDASLVYNVPSASLDVTAHARIDESIVGTLEASAECSFKNCWEMRFSRLALEDRYTGAKATFSGRLLIAPTSEGPEKPEGEEKDLLAVTPEQIQEMIREGREQIQWYIDKFFR